MKKYIKFLYLSVVITLVSCSDFLEETSPDITIPTTVQHYEELLYGEGYPVPQTAIAEVLSDNIGFNYSSVDTRDFRAITHIPFFLWEKDVELWQPNALTPLWTPVYKAISVCNLVLEGLAALPATAERDHVMGQAYALRAHHYFMLVNFFGEPFRPGIEKPYGVPIRTQAIAEDVKPARNTVDEVYALIDADLQQALTLMNSQENSALRGEMNHATALTIASKAALFQEKYEEVIALGTEYLALNIPLNNAGDDLSAGKFMSVQNKEVTLLYGGENREMSSSFLNTQLPTRSSLIVADDVFDLFEKNLQEGEYDQRVKWFFTTSSNGLRYPGKAVTANKRHAYRAAEIYLNMAEAYYHLNQHEKSLDMINALRRARITGFNPLKAGDFTGATLEELIEDERRREFCFEDYRWFDLRRYNRTVVHEYHRNGTKLRSTLLPNDWGYVLQIPLTEQNRNPNITLIPHVDRVHEEIN